MSDLNCQSCAGCCLAFEPAPPVTVPLTVADVDRLSKRQRRRWVVRREFKGRNGYWFALVAVPGADRFGCPALRGGAETGWTCTIYDHRPAICRAFPVGGQECRRTREMEGM